MEDAKLSQSQGRAQTLEFWGKDEDRENGIIAHPPQLLSKEENMN